MNAAVQPPPPDAPHGARRSGVHRFLETRGWRGGLTVPHLRARLTSADGTSLAGAYLPASRSTDTAVLVAHGFAANHRKPSYARLAEGLAATGPAVLTLDLRGHGRSGGRCTLGDREADDVAAGVAWLRASGHRHVTVVGASMGAAAALGAAAGGAAIDALALISGPAWFRHAPSTLPLRRLHTVWMSPTARTVLRFGVGVTLAGPAAWRHPPHPVEHAARTDVPMLVVHGADDGYFPASDADALAAAATGPSVVWHEPPGFGHAEDGFSVGFVVRLAAAIGAVPAAGRFPPRGG